jgi:hypothetical protein
MQPARHLNICTAWMVWLQRTILILMALALFLPATPVMADLGPKPTESFEFVFKIAKVDIVSGQLFQCDDSACQVGKPLLRGGPQGFGCTVDACDSLAYGYSKYQKLVITFTDGVRDSNVFTKSAFNAKYTVTVLEDSLQVEETTSATAVGRGCCASLGLTLVLETLLASLYLSAFRLPKSILGWVPVASLITLPFVWAVFPWLGLNGWLTTGLSETFAVIVETAFIYVITSHAIPLRHVAALSLAMNAFSFLVGLATTF